MIDNSALLNYLCAIGYSRNNLSPDLFDAVFQAAKIALVDCPDGATPAYQRQAIKFAVTNMSRQEKKRSFMIEYSRSSEPEESLMENLPFCDYLHDALSLLSRDEKIFLALRALSGLNYEQIAEIMETNTRELRRTKDKINVKLDLKKKTYWKMA